jgi:hypothetical protein
MPFSESRHHGQIQKDNGIKVGEQRTPPRLEKSDHMPMDRDSRHQDELRLRMQGPNAPTSTIRGHMLSQQMKANAPPPPSRTVKSHFLTHTGPSPASSLPESGSALVDDILWTPGKPLRSSKRPWFPLIDKAFNSLSPKWYLWTLLIGVLCGLGYARAVSLALAPAIMVAFLGAFAGAAFIPLVRFALKLVLTILAVGVVIGIFYFVFEALSTTR